MSGEAQEPFDHAVAPCVGSDDLSEPVVAAVEGPIDDEIVGGTTYLRSIYVQSKEQPMEKTPQGIAAQSLGLILKQYGESFSSKSYGEENEDRDPLMNVFGISPELKREHRQYWGRELGMCWQLLVSRAFELCRKGDFGPGYRSGADEMCDLMVGKMAIDTTYRIGSGDSGTLKKFTQYGKKLTSLGYQPVFLILRSDNLPAAIQACNVGGWRTLIGQATFDFILKESGFDIQKFLTESAKLHRVIRKPSTP